MPSSVFSGHPSSKPTQRLKKAFPPPPFLGQMAFRRIAATPSRGEVEDAGGAQGGSGSCPRCPANSAGAPAARCHVPTAVRLSGERHVAVQRQGQPRRGGSTMAPASAIITHFKANSQTRNTILIGNCSRQKCLFM